MEQRDQEKPSELSLRPEEQIHYPYLNSDQSPTNITPNPLIHNFFVILPYIIYNLHIIMLLSISFLFSWMMPSNNKIANISPKPSSVLSVWLCQHLGIEPFLFYNIRTSKTRGNEFRN